MKDCKQISISIQDNTYYIQYLKTDDRVYSQRTDCIYTVIIIILQGALNGIPVYVTEEVKNAIEQIDDA